MKKIRLHLSRCVLALGLMGFLANTASPIEVTPPSPVPALSPKVVMVPTIKMVPTVITVKYQVVEGKPTLLMVWAIVDGQMEMPEVTDDGVGAMTFSGPPGQYGIMGWEAGKPIREKIVVEEGDDPDPPPPRHRHRHRG